VAAVGPATRAIAAPNSASIGSDGHPKPSASRRCFENDAERPATGQRKLKAAEFLDIAPTSESDRAKLAHKNACKLLPADTTVTDLPAADVLEPWGITQHDHLKGNPRPDRDRLRPPVDMPAWQTRT
jgi:hypothetical protein